MELKGGSGKQKGLLCRTFKERQRKVPKMGENTSGFHSMYFIFCPVPLVNTGRVSKVHKGNKTPRRVG